MLRRYLVPAVCFTTASLFAQGPLQEGEAPRIAGEQIDTPASIVAPQATDWLVPAAFRTKMGNSNNYYPHGRTNMRYQQVFLGSEMTKPTVWRGVALRQTNTTTGRTGGTSTMTIRLGRTTYTHTNITTTFANNDNSVKFVTVANQVKFNIPDLSGRNTDPTLFRVQFPFTIPHVYTPKAGDNVLIEILNHSTVTIATYLDACSGTTNGSTTSRVYSTAGVGATTGSRSTGYGLVMNFLDKLRTFGEYENYGAGCRGTGGFAGFVVPAYYASRMGESNNYYPHGRSNIRYQQVFDGADIPRAGPLQSLAFRQDDQTTGRTGGSQTLKITIGQTGFTYGNIDFELDKHFDAGSMVVVNGSVNLPNLTGTNTNPQKFDVTIPFTQNYVWVPRTGKSLLIEVINTSTSSVLTYFDTASNFEKAHTARVYALNATATRATSGSRNYGLVMGLGNGGAGNATPELGNEGRPIVNASMKVTLAAAKPSTACALILGFSDKSWGAIQLPLDLTAAGMPGCRLLASMDILFPAAVDKAGNAAVTVNFPNDPGLIGGNFYNQYLVVDSGANSFGLAWTNAGKGTLGDG